ncbi:10511_t:CDS:1, partial [Scutellospora calospora]
WKGGYNYDIKERLKTFLQTKHIKYRSFIKYCNYSRNDFRKFLILGQDVSRKSYILNKKSLRSIIKKTYLKHINKGQIKRSYPIILYNLGNCFRFYKKKELMFEFFERSGKLGFKKTIQAIYDKTMWITLSERSFLKVDEERFHKSLKYICEK